MNIFDKRGLGGLITTIVQGLMIFGMLYWWWNWYKNMLIEELLK